MDMSEDGQDRSPVTAAVGLDPREAPPPGDGGDGDEKESERRRYHIIKSCAKNGSVSIDRLLDDKAFRRLFKKTARTTLSDDFKLILKMLGNGQRIARGKSPTTIELVRGHSSFADRGYYAAEPDLGGDGDPATAEKWRIGQFIVDNLLTNEQEVLYLSTGTTVYQVGLAVLRRNKSTIRVILTDNLAMVELFCQQARRNGQPRPMKLRILGGIADFEEGDIELNSEDFQRLNAWQCTTAVISATAVDPRTGCIFSFRQPQTKKEFFKDSRVDKIIIPVISQKIGTAGGDIIFDPSSRPPEDHRHYHIVTTRLDPDKREHLERHKYKVHETGQGHTAAAAPTDLTSPDGDPAA